MWPIKPFVPSIFFSWRITCLVEWPQSSDRPKFPGPRIRPPAQHSTGRVPILFSRWLASPLSVRPQANPRSPAAASGRRPAAYSLPAIQLLAVSGGSAAAHRRRIAAAAAGGRRRRGPGARAESASRRLAGRQAAAAQAVGAGGDAVDEPSASKRKHRSIPQSDPQLACSTSSYIVHLCNFVLCNEEGQDIEIILFSCSYTHSSTTSTKVAFCSSSSTTTREAEIIRGWNTVLLRMLLFVFIVICLINLEQKIVVLMPLWFLGFVYGRMGVN